MDFSASFRESIALLRKVRRLISLSARFNATNEKPYNAFYKGACSWIGCSTMPKRFSEQSSDIGWMCLLHPLRSWKKSRCQAFNEIQPQVVQVPIPFRHLHWAPKSTAFQTVAGIPRSLGCAEEDVLWKRCTNQDDLAWAPWIGADLADPHH